jgi:two-component system, cell cycle response regulator DivK
MFNRRQFDTLLDSSYKTPNRMPPEVVQPTILIAEDYDDNRELLRVLLTSANYKVYETSNGGECLEMARQLSPNLVMVDLSMPVLDGWELFIALRNDPTTRMIPCVAVTAHGETDRERALTVGFDGYLSKPFRSADLFSLVSSLVSPAPKQNVCQES